MVLVLKKGASYEEMQMIKEKLHQKPNVKSNKKGVDLRKPVGKLKLKEDPLVIQKKMRNDWG
jgi:hypothetical protein